MDNTDKEIGNLAVSLYDIATGPAHQDFIVRFKRVIMNTIYDNE